MSTSAPADPRRLTRQTFRLAHLPIPEPIATPLAELTTRVYLRPRGHAMGSLSASRAVARYAGPLLLVHGALDSVVPLARSAPRAGRLPGRRRAGRRGRTGRRTDRGRRHPRGPALLALRARGLPPARRRVPGTGARRSATSRSTRRRPGAAAVDALRIPDPEEPFAAVAMRLPGGRWPRWSSLPVTVEARPP